MTYKFDKSDAMKMLPFNGLLSDAQKEKLLNYSEIQILKKGDAIFSGANYSSGPFLILEGVIRAVIDDDGFRELTLFKLYPGEIGLLSSAGVLHSIRFDSKFIAETESLLLFINPSVIKKIVDDNVDVKCMFLETLVERFSYTISSMRDLFFVGYEKRFVGFLLEKFAFDGDTEIVITQEELAKLTGTVREVAGRTIRKFAKYGLIEYGRGRIKLLDLKRLREFSN